MGWGGVGLVLYICECGLRAGWIARGGKRVGETHRVTFLIVRHKTRVVDFENGVSGRVDEREVGRVGLVDVGDIT